MSKTLTIPFYAVRLHLSTGGSIAMPLMDMEAIRMNQPMHLLAGKYANLFQKKALDKGNYHKILSEYREGDLKKSSLKINFKASKDSISYPDFELEFDYYFNPSENGFWGIIPALGIEGFGIDENELEVQLVEATRLEFARKRRLNALQQVVSAIWFKDSELYKEDMLLKVYNPSELSKVEQEKKDELLPKIGTKLAIKKQVTFGRERELDALTKAATSSFNQNVLLIGPSGIGKTSMVWELSRQAKKHGIKEQIWETTASVLIKEMTRSTGWQDNIVHLCKELREKKDFLFIRNFAELFEVGKYDGNEVSMAEFLRSFVQRGDIKIISEITDQELAQIELKSPGYANLFQKIRLTPPPSNELLEIIIQKINSVAKQRKVELTRDAIEEVIRLHKRFTPYAGFPGKPIRFLESLLVNISQNVKNKILTKNEIIRYFCNETGMPTFLVDADIPMDLKSIKISFNNSVFGQEAAVEEVTNILGTVKTALTRTNKPIASFLFVGPTGVGKTELAKVLANFTFGSRNRMIRFDMSEFSNPWSVSRLTGTNYYSDGLLTAAVRREPFCVLLFDEIEKAHPLFFDLLLQILGEGRLTDSRGKLVNFCSTIIIMTSNIGATQMQGGRIGWKKDIDTKEIASSYKKAVEKHFRPELFNRIDQITPFEPLTKDTVRFVVEREIELIKKREGIAFRNMELKIDDSVLDLLAEVGYDPKYGARQLQRTIRERLIIPLSKELNLYDSSDRLIVELNTDNEQLTINIESDPLGFDLLLEQWDKLSIADQASAFRRKIARLKDGSTMIRFFNEFDQLELKKKRKGDAFWKNRQDGEAYSYFLQIIQNTQDLTKKISDLELKISLSCMDLGSYSPTFEDEISNWETSFFEFKKQIYTHLHPNSNKCFFAVYGTHFKEILVFYLELFKKRDFQISGNTIWFRDSYFHEELTELEIDEEKGETYPVKKERKEYLFKEWEKSKIEGFTPPESGDILIGIELNIEGDCPFLFLKTEEGFQNWKTIPNDPHKYCVRIANDTVETPKAIHRQNFYRVNNPRRTVEQNTVTDTELKLNREISRNGFMDVLEEVLEAEFRIAIEREVN